MISLIGCEKFNFAWAEKEKRARQLRELEKRVSDDYALSPHWKDFFLTTISLKRKGVIKDV